MSRKSQKNTLGARGIWGGIYFGVLLLFICYVAILGLQLLGRHNVPSYQVRSGALAQHNTYTGVVMRDEKVITGQDNGYVVYFAREGEHLGSGDLVYAIDEAGTLNDIENNPANESALTDQDLRDLRSEIIDFAAGFRAENYHTTYDFLYNMDGSLLHLANSSMMQTLAEREGTLSGELVKLSRVSTPGYVIYHTDGLESLSENGLRPEIFDEEGYERKILSNHALVGAGDPVYKLLTSENWQLAFPVDPTRAGELLAEGYVRVRFLKNRQELWGEVSLVPYDSEITYCVLSFNSSVINFCTDRFLEIELAASNQTGLKIPVSAIVHKEFFLVPIEYALGTPSDQQCSFLRKTFLEDGSASSEEVSIEIYSADEEYYYVDDTQLKIGDYLIKTDDQAEYPVGRKGELTGVYNINKGYADFRQISILYQNEEYAIVKSNTAYGLSEYDYIALDASSLTDDSFIFE
ncbi:MAG: hypothetical protein K6E50_10000 [Lachnospiraceae bacterium]|nr:hypothetical protein [Lachnospiraceae bacterium]